MQDTGDEICMMCGDVNLFISNDSDTGETIGEIEIMIAERESRSRGIATEALKIMMHYGHTVIHIDRYIAKIIKGNDASIGLFQRKLGYRLDKYEEWCQEYHLSIDLRENEQYRQMLADHFAKCRVEEYSPQPLID